MKSDFIRIGNITLIIWNSFYLSFLLDRKYGYVERYVAKWMGFPQIIFAELLLIMGLVWHHFNAGNIEYTFVIGLILFVTLGINTYFLYTLIRKRNYF